MKLLIVLALAVATANAASLNVVEQPDFPTGRIINGKEAEKGEAPWIVSIKLNSHNCGGSIIDKHWVLTAGHCLGNSKMTIVAGLHSRNDESEVQIRHVTRQHQIVHEKYANNVGPYDIGLIRIDPPFNLNALSRDGSAPVAQIALPSGKYSIVGDGVLYGWGRDNNNQIPNTLQKLDTDIINYKDCKAALPFLAPIHESNICVYRPGKTDGACNGDSGGPLVRRTAGGVEQVGVVSWGYTPCQTTTRPSVFTSVEYFKDWIRKTMNSY